MIFAGLLLVGLLGSAQGVKSYLSYQDAKCVNDDTIKGTAVVSYDDSTYEDYGYSLAYYGGCLYYKGGYLDYDDWSWDYDFYDYGTCVTCNDQVGCSSDGTCSNFMTNPGTTQSSGYQMTSKGGSSSQEVKAPRFGMAAQKTKEATLEAQEQSASAAAAQHIKSPPMMGAVIGGVVGVFGVFALMSLVAMVSHWRKKREVKIASSAILDNDIPTTQYHLSNHGQHQVIV